jgi:hypothetical protein
MSAHSEIVIEKFCGICQWTYDTWQTHKVLFDEGSHLNRLPRLSQRRTALVRISEITQSYWIQKIANFHDKATVMGHKTLSLDYIIKDGQWDEAAKKNLLSLKEKLDELYNKIKLARDKLLCHNDLKTYLTLDESSSLGSFPEGLDTKYFDILKKFASFVRENSVGVSFDWNTHAIVETQELVSALLK